MSENERDSHFVGWASSLWGEIEDKIIVVDDSMARHYHPLASQVAKEIQLLIARRAYDLALHITGHVAATMMDEALVLRYVPDLATGEVTQTLLSEPYKEDGDQQITVEWRTGAYSGERFVHLENTERGPYKNFVGLSPREAIRLLEWLEHNRSQLMGLIREEKDVKQD